MSWRRFRRVFRRDARRDVDDELSFHIEMRTRELMARGETETRAGELARQRFGDYDAPRRECIRIHERQGRRMAWSDWHGELRSDVVFAVRSLRRRPVFAAVAVLTLALGIGANSAIFSVVNGVLLQSLPYAHADRLYHARMIYPDGQAYGALSAPDFMSVAELTQAFEETGAIASGRAVLEGAGEPREITGALVTDGLPRMLGLDLSLGRWFSGEEHQAGRARVAVLEHGFWQREFGGAHDVLGRTVRVSGMSLTPGTVEEYTIAGVLAPGVNLPDAADLIAPLTYDESFSATAAAGRRSEYLMVLGRARAGVGPEEVVADMDRIGRRLGVDFPPTNERLTMDARPLREALVGDVRRPLLVLLGAVGFVLLVACANVANLLLARMSARREELAVRAAIGAGRGRLVRQLLTEALVLGTAGGAVGLLLAWAGTRALIAAQPADIPRLEHIGIDGVVVLVTVGITFATALLFGALPALLATRDQLADSLRSGARTGAQRSSQRLRSGLIVAEMALAVVLLVGAGLLIRSFIEMTRVDPGFEPDRAVAFRLSMAGDRYATGASIRAFVDEYLERAAATPGVTAAAGTSLLPLRGLGSLNNFDVDGAPPPPDNVNREISIASVTPGYFATIGARIVAGRDIGRWDNADAPTVALINEAAARFWFPGEDPIGRRVSVGSWNPEIVGIVSDVLQRSPSTPPVPQLFMPHQQRTASRLQIVVRTSGDPLNAAPALRQLLRSMDPSMPISDFTPLDDVISEAVARPRFYTTLLTLFAALALALAAVGIFGVMSYSVAQRAREISIRMALGARRGQVLTMIVGRALLLAAAGMTLGLLGALGLGRIVRSQLFNVGVMDPVTLIGVALVLGGSAVAASYLPARRAAALEPGSALREA